jgi:predicted nucleic acid-binding protein
VRFVLAIAQSSEVMMEWVHEERHNAAMALLLGNADKQYSLCDAVSFTIMRERGVTDELTTDRHFDQAGFRRLLPA